MKNIRAVDVCAVLLLSILIVGCETASPPSSPITEAPHPLDSDELLVLDPPVDYLRHLPDLGLEIIDVTDLPGMGSKIYHLRILDGSHPHSSRKQHSERFPDVVVDAHHHFEHHARKKKKIDKTYTARKATKWTSEKATCAKGMRVGVIDGVVDVKHKAFKGTKITYRSFHLKSEKLANSGHGTAVTSIITGRGTWGGLLPGVEIVAANVFHRGGNGKPVGSAKSIVRAIDWMIHQKVPIINLSLGGGPNALISKAIDHAAAKGVILIASSGNGGPFSKKKSYPGAYPAVIAITAVDRYQRNARFATSGKYIDFAAPGVDIWTAVPGGGKPMSGTSFAAPVVSAYAAAAWKHLGVKTATELRTYLKKHAQDRGKPGRDRYTGWGIVQLPPIC
jgi:subtilisin family serine protease